jgi:N-carbamoylputrescine amidase
MIEQAPPDRPAVLVAEAKRSLIEETRRNWPFLRDRRIDAYNPILERHLGEPPA